MKVFVFLRRRMGSVSEHHRNVPNFIASKAAGSFAIPPVVKVIEKAGKRPPPALPKSFSWIVPPKAPAIPSAGDPGPKSLPPVPPERCLRNSSKASASSAIPSFVDPLAPKAAKTLPPAPPEGCDNNVVNRIVSNATAPLAKQAVPWHRCLPQYLLPDLAGVLATVASITHRLPATGAGTPEALFDIPVWPSVQPWSRHWDHVSQLYHLIVGWRTRSVVGEWPRREQEERARHSSEAMPRTSGVPFKYPPPYPPLQPTRGFTTRNPGAFHIISRQEMQEMRAQHLDECVDTLRFSPLPILLGALAPIMVDCWRCLRKGGLPWDPLVPGLPSVLELNTRIDHFLGHSSTRLAWANMLCWSMRKFHKLMWFIAERRDVQQGCLRYMLYLEASPHSANGDLLLCLYKAGVSLAPDVQIYDSDSTAYAEGSTAYTEGSTADTEDIEVSSSFSEGCS